MSASSTSYESQVVSSKNLARINRDKKMLKVRPLDDERIYIMDDPDDIMVTRACIIGPKDTPYEDGIYLFKIIFPNNYPYSPPKVTYHTNDGKARMHPNFYTNGKVCVSIIGTWSGPGWTSCQSLYSVLVTIRSLMTPNPLWEEPGFRGENSERNRHYNEIISHENIQIGIIRMTNNPPDGFECFNHIIKYHLAMNMDSLLDKCTQMESQTDDNGRKINGRHLVSPNIFGFGCDINYTLLRDKLGHTWDKISQREDIYKEDLKRVYDSLSNEFTSFKETIMLIREITELDPVEILTLLSIQNMIVRNVKGDIRKTEIVQS